MGQQCAKQHQNGGVSPNSLSVSSTPQTNNKNVQGSHNKQAIQHLQLDLIIGRLQHVQVLKILVIPVHIESSHYFFQLSTHLCIFQDIFRDRCRKERSTIPISLAEKGVSRQTKRIWKRLTINEATLFATFPSIHTAQTRVALRSIIRNYVSSEPMSISNRLYAAVDELSLIDRPRLLQAFHIAHYLFRPEGVTGNACGKDITFQDFATGLAM